jgi:RES domain-containing protein
VGNARVDVVIPPEGGLWRVGRGPDPLSVSPALPPSELDRLNVGNRWDSALGNYRVLYFGSDLEACYGETLARFRPDLELLALVKPNGKNCALWPVRLLDDV